MEEESQEFHKEFQEEYQENYTIDSQEAESTVQRRLKQLHLRRKARRGEIAVRRIYKFFRFLLNIAIIYALYRLANAHYWYFTSTALKEPLGKSVEIIGNEIVPSEKILQKMRNYALPKKPIYMINPDNMSKGIGELQPIKKAYVRRFWMPARMVVMVEEVTPAIVIAPSETSPTVAGLAFSGELITREYLPLPSKYNPVKILSYGTKGDDYEKWDKNKINELYKIAKLIEGYSKEKLIYLDLRNPHNVFARLENVNLRLGELDSSIYERIKSIPTILPKVKHLNKKIKYVDLSWKESKYIKLESKKQESEEKSEASPQD